MVLIPESWWLSGKLQQNTQPPPPSSSQATTTTTTPVIVNSTNDTIPTVADVVSKSSRSKDFSKDPLLKEKWERLNSVLQQLLDDEKRQKANVIIEKIFTRIDVESDGGRRVVYSDKKGREYFVGSSLLKNLQYILADESEKNLLFRPFDATTFKKLCIEEGVELQQVDDEVKNLSEVKKNQHDGVPIPKRMNAFIQQYPVKRQKPTQPLLRSELLDGWIKVFHSSDEDD